MSASVLVPALVIFLHDLFTVLWIGGILFMAFVMMPALRTARPGLKTSGVGSGPMPGGAPSASRDGLLAVLTKKVQSRLGVVSIVSLVGLVVTGILLARRGGNTGFLRFDTAYAAVLSVKHLLVVALVAVSLVRRRLMERAGRAAAALLAASAVLAVAILALSALNAALA